MRAVNEKNPGINKKRRAVSRTPAAGKKRRVAAVKTSAVADRRILVEYPREAFEALSKLPKSSADCYHAEDDDL